MAVSDVNSVVLVGRLTRDPERRGSALAMRVAFNASRNTGSGWEDLAQFVDAACFGAQADALEGMLTKGTRVVLNGRLTWREWEGPDGSKRQAHSISCSHVQIVSGGRRDDEGAPAPVPASGSSAPETAFVSDDDIPF